MGRRLLGDILKNAKKNKRYSNSTGSGGISWRNSVGFLFAEVKSSFERIFRCKNLMTDESKGPLLKLQLKYCRTYFSDGHLRHGTQPTMQHLFVF